LSSVRSEPGAGWLRSPLDRPVRGWPFWLNAALLFLLLTSATVFFFFQIDYRWDWAAIWEYRQKFIDGWLATVVISLASLFISLLVGMLLLALQRSHWILLRLLGRTYVELIRGTPPLVQVIVFFYVVAFGLGLENRYVAGVLVLSAFSGAYIGEILRGGVESVAGSQLDAARAVGFDRVQTWRFVIGPQAIRQTLPALTGQLVTLVKDSSLLSVIAIREFTKNVQEANNFTFSAFEGYVPLVLGYLVLTLPISFMSRWLEGRFRYET